jgi:hypothetical protein
MSSLSSWLLHDINVLPPLSTGLPYQGDLVPVSAFHDVRSAFLAFLDKKTLAGIPSELGRRIADNFFEYSPEPCRI